MKKLSIFLVALLALTVQSLPHETGEDHDHDDLEEDFAVGSTEGTDFAVESAEGTDFAVESTEGTNSAEDSAEGEVQPEMKSICLERDCIAVSNRLFEFMNTEADPCQDFSEFACGGFYENQIIPDDKSRWGVFSMIAKDIENIGRKMMEAPIDEKTDNKADIQAKKLYKSCVNEAQIEELGLQPLRDRLEEIGGWPVLQGDKWTGEGFNAWDMSAKLLKMGYSNDYIASSWVYTDLKNNSYRVLYLDQADLGLSKEYWKKGLDEPEVKAYKQYMLDAAVLLGVEDQDNAEHELQLVMDFEMKLANISAPKEARRNSSKLYNPTTLGEFPGGPGLPDTWSGYIQKLFDFGDVKIDIDDSERVIIYDVDFYKNISKVLKATSERTKANYLVWRMVASTMKYLSKDARDVRRKYTKVLNGISVEQPVWKRCLKTVGWNSLSKSNFVYAVTSMYARKVFKRESKAQVVEMTDYLRRAFKQILDELEWMDDETKVEAHRKLAQMGQYIAYPDEYLDEKNIEGIYHGLDLDEETYFENAVALGSHMTKYYTPQLRERVNPEDWREHRYAAVVNAFYNPTFNNFEFPAGILQGTFFNPGVPKYMNFGAIGFVMGHEITHGFDDQGRQKDADGVLKDWWKADTNEKFQTKAQCIIDQYGNYTETQTGLNLNGVNTQGENIADNGGIKEAYLAYEMWERDNQVEEGLPGHSYSSRQLFWISAAQAWCSKYRTEKLKNQILTGQHSIEKFRIIGPFSNNKDFAKDFKCPPGSGMNPVKKCVVW